MLGALWPAIYERMDRKINAAGLGAVRAEVLSAAEGTTLELGAGTGSNLSLYPATVSRLVLSEPDRHMLRRLRRAARVHGPDAEVVRARAEQLPFADSSFDTVVVTMSLCTIPDPRAALAEARRVLRDDGLLLFCEHVRAAEAPLARRQDRIAPIYRLLCGCRPNRDTLATIRAAGFEVEQLQHGEVPQVPAVERPMIAGRARRGARLGRDSA